MAEAWLSVSQTLGALPGAGLDKVGRSDEHRRNSYNKACCNCYDQVCCNTAVLAGIFAT